MTAECTKSRILVIIKGDLRFFYSKLAEAIHRNHSCSVVAVVFNTPTERIVRKLGFFEEVYNLASFLKQHGQSKSVSSLQSFDCKAEPGLAMAVHADRILRTYSFENASVMAQGIHAFWCKVYAESQPTAVFGEIACAAEWIAVSLARQHGVLYLAPYPTPVTDRFFFITEPQGLWDQMANRYVDYSKGRIPANEYDAAAHFLAKFRASKQKPNFLLPALRSPLGVRPGLVIKRLGRVPYRVSVWHEDGKFDVGSYEGTPPWESALADLAVRYRHTINEATYFDRALHGGPKMYFPLHMQPEFTTDVRAPFFVNQPALIEAIAKSLPHEYRLAVKEHPAMKGQRKGEYYRSIRRLYNVQLLSPAVDSHDVISQSDMVFTITGSTGWEAILYEKPVVSFGHLCYEFFGSVHFCNNIKDLPYLVRSLRREFRPDPEQIVRFIAALFASAHTGRIGHGIGDDYVLSRENVDRVAAAIYHEASDRSPVETTQHNR